jgi:putative RNA 2'-phosphotransferase
VPKKDKIRREDLSRFMIYILGYRPGEFGLVPDSDGFITYKELLQAIHEEPDWGYVRKNHFNEILMGNDRFLFEWDDKRIRAKKREWTLNLENTLKDLPKILFIAVRKRAHPHVMEKGLMSAPDKYLPLSTKKDMAMRIGRRYDQNPVLLQVSAFQAEKWGIPFYSFGQLYLAKEIPAGFISGPPVSREEMTFPEQSVKRRVEKPPDFTPGSFLLDLDRQAAPRSKTKGKKRKGWKEDARKLRRKRGQR